MKHVRRWRRVGAVGVLLGLAACTHPAPLPSPPTPVSVATAIPSPTPVPTLTPTCTPLPSPTLTPSPTPTPVRPPGADRWVLAEEDRERLYQVSLRFLAPTPEEALVVARDLQFLSDHGHPSNMCGPLGAAILRDAGLIDPYVILHEFWLLNPREQDDAWLLDGIFPAHRYATFTTTTPLDEFDFQTFPLQPGDFLYLYAGLGGTFEHVVVVNRVDERGRAFAVSNVKREAGFVVEEVLLYDPNRPGVGMFYQWTDPAYLQYGQTGLGGFRLWRPTRILRTEGGGEAADAFRETLDRILAHRGGHWNVLVRTMGGDVLYYRRAGEIVQPAPMIEVPIGMLFFHALEQQGVDDTSTFVQTNGVQGRTFDELLWAMLVSSDPTATSALALWVGGQVDEGAVLDRWGLHNTGLDPRRSCAWDAALALESLIRGELVSPEGAAVILGLMAERGGGGLLCERQDVACALDWRVRGGVVGGAVIVEAGAERYVLVTYGRSARYGEPETTWEDLGQGVEEVHLAFAAHYVEGGAE